MSWLSECHLSSSYLSGLRGNHSDVLLSLLGPVLALLLSVLLRQLIILGLGVHHELAEVLRFGGV